MTFGGVHHPFKVSNNCFKVGIKLDAKYWKNEKFVCFGVSGLTLEFYPNASSFMSKFNSG